MIDPGVRLRQLFRELKRRRAAVYATVAARRPPTLRAGPVLIGAVLVAGMGPFWPPSATLPSQSSPDRTASGQDSVAALAAVPPGPDPVAVVRGMAGAFNDGDVEGVLDHFTADLRLTLRPAFPSTEARTDSGAAFLREWVEELVAGDFRIELEILEVEGDRVRTRTTTWQDVTRWTGMAPVVGIEDYIIEDGRIARLTWTATEATWDRYYAFRTRSLVVLGVVTLGLLGIVFWLACRMARRPRT